ncbi:MAG: hypothetical protein IT244_01280, partial [Bacteroidia bacterium]|nr:hypothetical protein [Bacteroidia bacterium]
MIVHNSKKVVLGLAYMAAALLLLQACRKKEITIIEQDNPPDLQIYGTWLLQNTDANDTSKTYMVLTDKQTNYYYMLYQDKWGFKTKSSGIFFATENTLDLNDDYNRRNYKKVNDTLWLSEAVGATEKYVKQNNTTITYDNWTKQIKIRKTITAPSHFQVYSNNTIGVNGDDLYFNPYNSNHNKIYKYNTVTQKYTDSTTGNYS